MPGGTEVLAAAVACAKLGHRRRLEVRPHMRAGPAATGAGAASCWSSRAARNDWSEVYVDDVGDDEADRHDAHQHQEQPETECHAITPAAGAGCSRPPGRCG